MSATLLQKHCAQWDEIYVLAYHTDIKCGKMADSQSSAASAAATLIGKTQHFGYPDARKPRGVG